VGPGHAPRVAAPPGKLPLFSQAIPAGQAVPDDNFGRFLAAYGGIFVAGSIAWGMVADGYRLDRFDVIGALVCLAGMAVIMYAPRSH